MLPRACLHLVLFALLCAFAYAWDAKIEAMLTDAYDASVVARGTCRSASLCV